MEGPYHSLNAALHSEPDRLLTVTPATERVESSELSYQKPGNEPLSLVGQTSSPLSWVSI